MKKNLLKSLLLLPVLFIASCASDDSETPVTEVDSKTYTLTTFEDSGISGAARFIKNSDNTLSIELNLLGTVIDDLHAAYLYLDNAANSSNSIALTLEPIDGELGTSTTTFTRLDDETIITYEELLNFDGYIGVNSNDQALTTVVARADVGQNELTNISTTYTLNEVDLTDASGAITFRKRLNGEALATFNLTGTPASGMHPAHIHAGSVATAPGAIIFTFNMVNGSSGSSETNISKLTDSTPFLYDNVLTVDGYINVHFSASDLSHLIAQGNIGSN